MYSHKKYVILQHLLLMRLIVDTRWAEGAKRLCFTCGACETCKMVLEQFEFRVLTEFLIVGAEIAGKNTAKTRKATR